MARPKRRIRGKKKFAVEARKVREAGEQVKKRVTWQMKGWKRGCETQESLTSPFFRPWSPAPTPGCTR